MRLIDANTLHKEISEWPESVMYKDWVQAAIANAPTIDPPPNDPLTLDELREMDGEPVWVSWAGHSSEGWALVRVWSKVNSTIYMTYHNGATDLLGYILNNGAKIYRRKPEDQKT